MKRYIFLLLVLMILLSGSQICYAKDKKLPVEGKGYIGTLPDLTRDYQPKSENKENKSVSAIPSKDFNSENELKPIPVEDPGFVNIILKKEKSSKYTNDIVEFISILEGLYDLIDDNANVQLFNAKVYYFNKNADYFRDQYAQKPEGQYISYKRILELSMHASSIAQLRSEAEKYNPYLAYGGSGYIYNPNNIQEQIGYLKTEIQQTILLLRESI